LTGSDSEAGLLDRRPSAGTGSKSQRWLQHSPHACYSQVRRVQAFPFSGFVPDKPGVFNLAAVLKPAVLTTSLLSFQACCPSKPSVLPKPVVLPKPAFFSRSVLAKSLQYRVVGASGGLR